MTSQDDFRSVDECTTVQLCIISPEVVRSVCAVDNVVSARASVVDDEQLAADLSTDNDEVGDVEESSMTVEWRQRPKLNGAGSAHGERKFRARNFRKFRYNNV